MDLQDILAKQMQVFVVCLSFDDFETKPDKEKTDQIRWFNYERRTSQWLTLIVDSGNCNSAANSQRRGRLT